MELNHEILNGKVISVFRVEHEYDTMEFVSFEKGSIVNTSLSKVLNNNEV